jgi:hypothetical protein
MNRAAIIFVIALSSCLAPKPEAVSVVVEEIPEVKAGELNLNIERAVDGIFFIPQNVSALSVPDDAGVISEKDLIGVDGEKLRYLFRSAYNMALMRDIPLAGVLGIDRVHRWPEGSNLTWAQNWRSSSAYFNSWGISGLVLAMLNSGGDRVFTVRGDILDFYGKTQGVGGANGILGYGAPLGDDFFLKLSDYALPVHAQRFDKGLIYVNSMGKASFIAGEAPSLLIENDETAGFYLVGEAGLQQYIKIAFSRAYKSLIDRYERYIKADGAVRYLNFTGGPWLVELAEGLFTVTGFYIQYYDDGNIAIVLPVFDLAPPFPPEAIIIDPPFSEVLLGGIRLPSSAELAVYPVEEDAGNLLKSFALYGIPLTDSFVSIETMTVSQRFSKGVFRSSILY